MLESCKWAQNNGKCHIPLVRICFPHTHFWPQHVIYHIFFHIPHPRRISHPHNIYHILVIVQHNHVLIISCFKPHTHRLAHIYQLQHRRGKKSSRWSKDHPHNPIERLLHPYVMAIDSTITRSNHMLNHNASYSMVLHDQKLGYIIYNSYTSIRWLSTLTWSVILNLHTIQAIHQSSMTVTYNNHQVGNIRIPSRILHEHTHAQFTHKHTHKHIIHKLQIPIDSPT